VRLAHGPGAPGIPLRARLVGVSRKTRLALIVPTSRSDDDLTMQVEADLRRLGRPEIELAYHLTGSGPTAVRSPEDAIAAAPGVVGAAQRLAHQGFDGLIVDCTDDPGVDIAAAAVAIPVIGPGAALRDAAAAAPRPIRWWSGDDLRAIEAGELDDDDLARAVGDARTIALGSTGSSHVTERLRRIDPSLVVLDPLHVAVTACIEAVRRADRIRRVADDA
jgi:Asp/Glu/hydantoin racemase